MFSKRIYSLLLSLLCLGGAIYFFSQKTDSRMPSVPKEQCLEINTGDTAGKLKDLLKDADMTTILKLTVEGTIGTTDLQTIKELCTSPGKLAVVDLSNADVVSKVIPEKAFDHCESLSYIALPEDIVHIGKMAFLECVNLTAFSFPEKVKEVPGYMFYNCGALTAVDFAEGIDIVGVFAFDGCTSLLELKLPKSLKKIEEIAFYGCTSLTEVSIPEGVTHIGEYAFSRCFNLKSASIPSTVTSIGPWAFGGCDKLSNVMIHAKQAPQVTIDSFSKWSRLKLFVPKGCLSAYKAATNWNRFEENLFEMQD